MDKLPFGRTLGALYRLTLGHYSDTMAKFGLCGIDGAFIYALRDEALLQKELADVLKIDKSNVTRRLKALEEKGYVRRTQKGRGKDLTISLTAAGTKLAPQIDALYASWLDYLTEGLSEEDIAHTLQVLTHMVERAGHHHAP